MSFKQTEGEKYFRTKMAKFLPGKLSLLSRAN